jgi:hypothetical protein
VRRYERDELGALVGGNDFVSSTATYDLPNTLKALQDAGLIRDRLYRDPSVMQFDALLHQVSTEFERQLRHTVPVTLVGCEASGIS